MEAGPVASQEELVEQLRDRGLAVTQATVSRDIAELGLAKVVRDGRHVYVAEVRPAMAGDDRLRRIVADIPIRIGRSGLTLVLTALPGTASVIAQAIDQSGLDEQEGTLAGDNTLLVLFARRGAPRALAHPLHRAPGDRSRPTSATARTDRDGPGSGAPDTRAAELEARS